MNLVATPALLSSAGKDDEEAGWNGTHKNKMEIAAIKIGQTLIPALEAFINGLAKASGFLSVTEQEMIKFQGRAAKQVEEQNFFHYKLMKTEAQETKIPLPSIQISSATSSNQDKFKSFPAITFFLLFWGLLEE